MVFPDVDMVFLPEVGTGNSKTVRRGAVGIRSKGSTDDTVTKVGRWSTAYTEGWNGGCTYVVEWERWRMVVVRTIGHWMTYNRLDIFFV